VLEPSQLVLRRVGLFVLFLFVFPFFELELSTQVARANFVRRALAKLPRLELGVAREIAR
jgi:hypothetical protein